MSHKYNDIDDIPPDEELPSYEDVIKQEESTNSQSSHYRPPPPRPSSSDHSAPPRPSSSSHSAPPRPPRPTVPSSNHAPVSNIPWVYPRGFFCPKCNNTGYKTKNGKSCKSCWRRFARQNSTPMAPSGYGSNVYQSSPIYAQPQTHTQPYGQPMQMRMPMQMAPQRPLYVRPGDPRIGGVICGNCRGSGRIRFLLDEDICGVCNGLGRIIGR